MHLQIISVTLHNYTACEPTDCNMKNPLHKILKRTSSNENFYYLVNIMYMIFFSFILFYYYIDLPKNLNNRLQVHFFFSLHVLQT